MTPPTRPIAPAPIAENIPAELEARRQFIVWRYKLRKDKWTKVPYTPGTTSKARSNAPSTWRSFAEALACYQEGAVRAALVEAAGERR
jgi:primase-polymerase (primpol)-like protein